MDERTDGCASFSHREESQRESAKEGGREVGTEGEGGERWEKGKREGQRHTEVYMKEQEVSVYVPTYLPTHVTYLPWLRLVDRFELQCIRPHTHSLSLTRYLTPSGVQLPPLSKSGFRVM